MPHMKRMMDPMMMMGRRGKEMMYGKGKEKGAKKLMKKLMEMGITPAAKMGNGEKLLQKSMGMGGPLDMTVMAENSMRYGGATTYSGPSKSKKAKKAKKGRKR